MVEDQAGSDTGYPWSQPQPWGQEQSDSSLTKPMARLPWKPPQCEKVGFKLRISRQERNCKFNWPEINHFRSRQTKITFSCQENEIKIALEHLQFYTGN